jgi:ribosomal protein S18 acetylase RimI-like enzyme
MSWSEREFVPGDYEAARALWAVSEGVGQGPGDTEGGVHRFLRRNRGLSFVALRDGVLVGAVLCGHDGRRGFIYHLAVAASARRSGIAKSLTRRCLAALESEGIERCQVFVRVDNSVAIDFWGEMNGRLRTDLCVFSIPLGGA